MIILLTYSTVVIDFEHYDIVHVKMFWVSEMLIQNLLNFATWIN